MRSTMSAPDADSRHADAAVIDVGSNSVRLVLYRLEGRAIWTVFNEKVLGGSRPRHLGHDRATVRRRRISRAWRARRFAALIAAAKAETGACRRHGGGARRRGRPGVLPTGGNETGLSLRVLSGAGGSSLRRRSASGRRPAVRGLGRRPGRREPGTGASSTRGVPGDGVTLPLGPFALEAPFDAGRVRAAVAKRAAICRRGLSFQRRSMRSAAPGGTWLCCTCSIPAIRWGSFINTNSARREALDAARSLASSRRASLERIEGVSGAGVEGCPMRPPCWRGSLTGPRRREGGAVGLRPARRAAVRGHDPRTRRGTAIHGGRLRRARRAAKAAAALGAALEAWLGQAFARLASLLRLARQRASVRRVPPGGSRSAASPRSPRRPGVRSGACGHPSPARITPNACSWPAPLLVGTRLRRPCPIRILSLGCSIPNATSAPAHWARLSASVVICRAEAPSCCNHARL